MSFNSLGIVQYRVRTALILALRQAFSTTYSTKYPYLELPNGEFDYDNSNIFISDVTPDIAVAYPYVIVDTVASEEIRYLGPDLLWDAPTETINFTSIPLTANIKIWTRDTITRDNLISAVYDSLKINKNELALSGVEVIQTRWAPETREFNNDRWWYVSTISMDLYAEWSTSTAISTITGVTITNVFTTTTTSEF